MNTNDDMHRFITVLMRYGIAFALIAAILLLAIAALLVWRPMVLLEILRYTIAAICVGVAVWIIFAVLVGLLKRLSRNNGYEGKKI